MRERQLVLVSILAVGFGLSAAACDSGSTTAADGDVPDVEDVEDEVEAELGADADGDAGADSDADADADADGDVGPDVVGACEGECLAGQRTECTCDPSDPCGWSGDEICDERRCDRTVGFSFDDGADCESWESCGGDCAAGSYNECTCDARNPCRWARNGSCDTAACEAAVPGGVIFDDTQDCACDGDCSAGVFDACTCGVDDPCGWTDNRSCERTACETALPGSPVLADTEDCVCDGGCLEDRVDACTCGVDDPCGWSGNGTCEHATCEAALPGLPVFADTADCAALACEGACSAGTWNACTCGVDDPCGWASDGFCDGEPCELVLPGAHFGDGTDCTVVPGAPTFGSTSVVNELNRNDMYVFADEMVARGYTWVVRDPDVTRAELISYLERDLEVLYHTSHGNTGVVAVADGMVGISDVTLVARNSIFATCLTLANPWDSAFGPSAETVLGYTDLSYDMIDDDVARDTAVAVGGGAGWMLAWYQANIGVGSLADRWAGYVREGADIVEYSARTGAIPTKPEAPGEWVALDGAGRLWTTVELLGARAVFDVSSTVLAVRPGVEREVVGVPGAWSRLARTTMTPAEAVESAEASLGETVGGVPADAVLERVFAVVARREGGEPVVVGWVVRWAREVAGVPVRGNGVADHVAVLVAASGVVATSWWWPALDEVAASAPTGPVLFDAASALRLAAGELSAVVKGELRLRAVRGVWGTRGPGSGVLVPAWEYSDGAGGAVVVDAFTGLVLR